MARTRLPDDERRRRRRENSKRWRLAHPERARETSRRNERIRRMRSEVVAASKKWRLDNPGLVKIYGRRTLCSRHGITLEEYEGLLASQGGSCAICRKASDEAGRSLCIDHDHSCCPGTFGCRKCIRGIICSKCNQGIGCFSENLLHIDQAIKYLSSHRYAFR